MSAVTGYWCDFRTITINDLRTVQFPILAQDPIGGVDRQSAMFTTIAEQC